MADLPQDLRTALDAALSSVPGAQLTATFQRLSTRYREEQAATSPIDAEAMGLLLASDVLPVKNPQR